MRALPITIANTPMAQTSSNDVIVMPDPSNKNSSPDGVVSISSGHRSTQRASAEKPAAESSTDAGMRARATQPEPATGAPSTEVFAVFGVEPEIQAYAMAKYSRSALSMKESLREI